jgi:large repetitive protein
MRNIAVACAALAFLVTACGRVPLGSVPSPSTGSTPTVDASPVAGETPTTHPNVSSKPTTSPKASPGSTPSGARSSPSASPTYAALVAKPPTFHAGEVRIAYADVTFGATGGKSPYTWSVSGGAVPDGLGLSAGGTVSGTPTAAGTFSFTALVTDVRGVTASAPGSINVANYLSGNGICTKGCSVENLCVTVCGTYAKPIGGVAPFSYKPSALPPSTTFGWPALGGQFTSVGTYSFSVTVTDSLGASTGVSAIFNVFPHISLKYGAPPGGALKVQYTYTAYYSGGSGVPTVSILKGSLPPGLKPSVNATAGTVVISGIPTTAGSYSFYLRITDSNACSPSGNCYFQTALLTINVK